MFLLLIKGVYLYEYMDQWENFNETLLPKKDDVKNTDYMYAKRVCKKFKIKKLKRISCFVS